MFEKKNSKFEFEVSILKPSWRQTRGKNNKQRKGNSSAESLRTWTTPGPLRHVTNYSFNKRNYYI